MPMMVLSTQKTSAPTVPTGLNATAASTSQINLSWSASSNVSGSVLVGYKVYRNGSFVSNNASTTFSDIGLAESTLYTYTVSSYTAKAESARSGSANATTQSSSPGSSSSVAAEGSGTEWTTFGYTFAPGEVVGAPFLAPSAGGAVTHQAVVQALHPDQSVRHAVFSAQLTGGVNYTVSDGTAPSGTAKTVADLLAAIPGDIARINLTAGITGNMTVRDLLTSATNRAKLNNTSSYYVFESGPQMLGVVVAQDFSTHLRVSMHLRWYGGTTLWCDFLFERGYCTLNGMGSASYTAELVLNGASKSTTVLAPHYNRTMWHKAFWSTGGTLYPRLTGAALIASKAVARYDTSQVPGTPYLNGLRSSTVPMDNGDNTDDLDDTGYQPSLGLMARWDASFITSNCDVRTFNCMLANADGGMAYIYSCLMDSVTGEMLSLSDHQTFTDQGDVGVGTGFASGLSPFDAGVTGQPAAHNMSVGYLAYALTGQWSFLRAMQSWASYLPFWTSSSSNHTYNGVTVRRGYGGSVRGLGWTYRTVGQAAYITPDSHYLKAYYNNTINGNFLRDYQEFNASYSPIGLIESSEVTAEGPDGYRLFMHNFLSQAVSHLVCDLGFATGLPFARHVATFVAGLMGNTNEYKWNFSAEYNRTIGTGSAQANWYTTFTQMNADTDNVPAYAAALAAGSQALANAMDSNNDIPNPIAGSITGRCDDATSYYANMQPAVSFLEALSMSNGATCWTRYVTGEKPAYNDTPQFSVLPRTLTTPPTWVPLLTVGTWTPISGPSPGVGLSATNVHDNVQPSNTGQFGNSGPDYVFYAWGGAALVPFYGAKGGVVHWNGGHQDYYGNEVYVFDLDTRTWVRLNSPSVSGGGFAGPFTNGILSDGKPNVAHTYYFVAARGREFITSKRQIDNSPNSAYMVSRFNVDTLAWTNSTAAIATLAPTNDEGICYDPTRDCLWMVNTNPLEWAKYSFATDSWTTYTNPTGAVQPECGPVFCEAVDCVVEFVTGAIWALDPSNPTTDKVTLTPSGSGPTPGTHDCARWSNNLGAIVFYPSGTNSIYLLRPPSGNWRTGTWTWSLVSTSGTSGSHFGNGTYGKFNVAEWGTYTVATVCDDVNGAVYVNRLQ